MRNILAPATISNTRKASRRALFEWTKFLLWFEWSCWIDLSGEMVHLWDCLPSTSWISLHNLLWLTDVRWTPDSSSVWRRTMEGGIESDWRSGRSRVNWANSSVPKVQTGSDEVIVADGVLSPRFWSVLSKHFRSLKTFTGCNEKAWVVFKSGVMPPLLSWWPSGGLCHRSSLGSSFARDKLCGEGLNLPPHG